MEPLAKLFSMLNFIFHEFGLLHYYSTVVGGKIRTHSGTCSLAIDSGQPQIAVRILPSVGRCFNILSERQYASDGLDAEKSQKNVKPELIMFMCIR